MADSAESPPLRQTALALSGENTGVGHGLSESDGHSVKTAEMLDRLAAELDRLTGNICRVECALPLLLENTSRPVGAETRTALQDLDLIAQTVAALSGFLRGVTLADPQARIDIGTALQRVPLSDLSRRLGGAPAATLPLASDPLLRKATRAPGEVEFF